MAGEVVTLQLGHYAGCVGAHWWGLQVGRRGRGRSRGGGGKGALLSSSPFRPSPAALPPGGHRAEPCRAAARRAGRLHAASHRVGAQRYGGGGPLPVTALTPGDRRLLQAVSARWGAAGPARSRWRHGEYRGGAGAARGRRQLPPLCVGCRRGDVANYAEPGTGTALRDRGQRPVRERRGTGGGGMWKEGLHRRGSVGTVLPVGAVTDEASIPNGPSWAFSLGRRFS